MTLRRDIFYHPLRRNGWTESHQIFTDRVKQCAEYIDCLKIYFVITMAVCERVEKVDIWSRLFIGIETASKRKDVGRY